MNEVSNNVLTHIVIFHDGSKKHINESQASLLFQASTGNKKSITTPQLGMITFSSISKILEIKDYYEQYPAETPSRLQEFKPESRKEYKTIEEMALSDESRRNGLIIGITKFIQSEEKKGRNPVNAKAILERWLNKKTDQSKETEYHQKTIDKYKDRIDLNESEKMHYNHALKKISELGRTQN